MSHRQWRWKDTKHSDKKKRELNMVKAAWFKKNPLGLSMDSLIVKADRIFSRFKRLEALMPAGYIRCFTCGAFISFRQSDNGHYVGREHMGTRYCEQNCEPECHSCNRYAEGVKAAFALNLQKKYGSDILDKLEKMRVEGRFITTAKLEEIIETYKVKVKELEIRKSGG